MKTRSLYGALAVLGLVVSTELALAQHHPSGEKKEAIKEAPSLPSCPVMGDEPVNLSVGLATPEGPVFFCCKDCIPRYQADPDKYAAKVTAQREALITRPKAQVKCPTCQQPANAEILLESGGQKILFSTVECMAKYKSEPSEYASALANSYTYQTKCPVMGEDIDPQAFATLANGTKVYFCCKGCDKKLVAEPAKYLPKLAAQGIVLDPKDLTAAPAKAEPAHDHKGHDHKDHDH